MKKEDIERLRELRWEHERKTKQAQLDKKLKKLLGSQEYSFLSFQESDRIQQSSDSWPSDKWERHLYLQVDIQKSEKVTAVIKKFLELTDDLFCHLFCLNFNFGLVRISKRAVIDKWVQLIDIDRDEIFLSLPGKSDFLCVEKTEDRIVGQEDEGRKWIFEISYSSVNLKLQMVQNGT